MRVSQLNGGTLVGLQEAGQYELVGVLIKGLHGVVEGATKHCGLPIQGLLCWLAAALPPQGKARDAALKAPCALNVVASG